MFERFTDRARRVVVLAQEEARMLNHNYIGTEHILLALIREGGGVAAQALEPLGITEEAARQQVEEIVGRGQQDPPRGHIPFTPRAKKILQLSLREAIALGHGYIGTEHILLGLVREGEGVAIQVLNGLGIDPNRVRQQVIQLVSARRVQEEPGTGHALPGEAQAVVGASRPSRLAGLALVGTGTTRRHLSGPGPARPGDHPGPQQQGKRHRRPGLRERCGASRQGTAVAR
jgi:ATP-dependent Clp protease ATP-binding subunit ClpC